MKIFIIYRGPFGEQIINNLVRKGFADKITGVYELTPETIEEEHPDETDLWSKVWENPEKYVPKNIPLAECDLLLVLGIHSKLGDLIPSIAEKLGAKAVLYPIDDRKHAPAAKKTIEEDLKAKGIHVEFPEPFCTLEGSENEFINEFAKHFGRPKFKVKVDKNKKVIKEFKVIRDSPSGSATCSLEHLLNFPLDDRVAFMQKIYNEHHNEGNPNYCLAEMDPVCPLMQEAGDIFKDAVFEACGFPTTKEVMLKKIGEFGEIDVDRLKEIIVGAAGDWANEEKQCDAVRTIDLYIDELVKEGKIIKIDGKKPKLKLAT